MSLIKLNNNAVKYITSVGSVSTGDLVFISKQTASSSASISFTSGIDSTYKEYVFYFVNMHPATDGVSFGFLTSTNGGSSYGMTTTTTGFNSYHAESDSGNGLTYDTGNDLAQSTSLIRICSDTLGNDNDQNLSGYLHLFNPSSTTFVKHFIANVNVTHNGDYSTNDMFAGYINDGTNDIDAIKFQMTSGNIDAGSILMFGIN